MIMAQPVVDDPTALLEFHELEAKRAGRDYPVEDYAELLARYLLQNDLCNGKYLWKRTPPLYKEPTTEIAHIWLVGQHLWNKDMPNFYNTIRSYQWTPRIAPIMQQLIVSTQEKMWKLIGTAYTSIRPTDVAGLLGITEAEVLAKVNEQHWAIADGLIEPAEPVPEEVEPSSAEDHLGKLTTFVTVLEN